MKFKLLLSFLLSFYFYLLSSQIPQGFNYQAIARDGSGNPITGQTMQVKIGILSDTIANIMVWEELFNPVKTNAFGLFNIVVGTGVKQSGSAGTFSVIDWTKTPLFLRTSIYYPASWKVMGTSKLQSVPYSMVAGNLEGSVPLLSVKGNTTTMDSALFVVRNNTGQIVFAVYNEGVRIYVDDGKAKGATKGGFAIGSFDRSKGTSQPLFVVDPDSIRAYLDNNPVKAVKGGFAIGSFDRSKSANQNFLSVSKDSIRMYIDDNLTTKSSKKGGFAIGSFDKSKGGNNDYFNVSPDSVGRIYPSQNRILWYPLKNAFLAGKIIAENKDSVGVNSFATGYESRSKGKYSQALGYKAIARGDYSTAIGKNAIANKINSFAFGESAEAANIESYAIGRGAIARGYRSFAFGSAGVDTTGNPTDVTHAIGDYSFAIGQGSNSIGIGSISIGIADTAKGDFSVALGYENSASGFGAFSLGVYTMATNGSTAMGFQTSATNSSTALGSNTNASGQYSTAMGNSSIASGKCSTAMGYSSYAKAMASTAMGWVTWAIGQSSTAMGEWATASGYSSTAMGEYTTASGDFSTAMGNNTTAPSGSETAIGAWNTTYTPISKTGWNASDRLFVIGNGTSSAATSNAVTVLKNGKVGIGTSTPQYPLEVVPVPVLGTTAGNTVSWERLYGFSSNSDQLRLFHRRYSSGSDWTSAEIRIQKTVDITDMGYISFKANYLEFGNGTTPQFTITNSGNVGIGTTNPGTKLAIVGLTGSATGSTLIINGNNVYYLTSKKDSKKDIEPLADNFDKILQAQPVSFSDKATGMKGIGYIAEDFEKEGLQNLLVYENGKLVSLRYDLISVYNLEIIKEQQKQIDSYKLQLESLNEKVKQIESQQKEIDELKTLVNTLVANQTGQGNK